MGEEDDGGLARCEHRVALGGGVWGGVGVGVGGGGGGGGGHRGVSCTAAALGAECTALHPPHTLKDAEYLCEKTE